jgi:hypothetical protein
MSFDLAVPFFWLGVTDAILLVDGKELDRTRNELMSFELAVPFSWLAITDVILLVDCKGTSRLLLLGTAWTCLTPTDLNKAIKALVCA